MGCHRSKKPVRVERRSRVGLLATPVSTFLLVFLLIASANARTRRVLIDSVSVQHDSLFVTFQAPGLFDNTVLKALRRGATTAIEYELRLWRDRKIVPDALVSTRRWRDQVVYDHLEMKYLFSEPDTSAGVLLDLEEVMHRCEHRTRELVYTPVSGLKPGRYFVSVSVVVEPLAVENYKELKRWVSGEARTLAERLKKRDRGREERGRLFQILLELTGFGDRVRGGRSLPFEISGPAGATTGK